MDYIIQDGELYHHGVKGQRWGVRRFQNADGSLTNAGKKRVSRKQKKALEKARKTKQEKAEAAKNAKQEQEDFETAKKRALESGSAADVLKFKGKLTNQELQQAVFRINMERQLSDISAKETKTGLDKAEQFMNKVDRVNKMVGKGVDAYNTVAKILNSTTNTDMPIIKEDAKKKADNVAKKTAEEAKKVADKVNKEKQNQQKTTDKDDRKTDDGASSGGDHKVYTGTVVGEGTSKGSRDRKRDSSRKNTDDIILDNDEWRDTSVSNIPKRTESLGQSYIAALLAPPKDDD